jgi:hypothetical protein
LEELAKQAREEGFLVFTIPQRDYEMYLMYVLGILVGVMIAGW